LFIIPSLRARRPRGWEKLALDIAFLGSPLITIAVPFVIKDPSVIWSANCAFFVASYAYGYAVGRGEGAVATGGFSGVLRWLDFGSGQERGVRGVARERFLEQQGRSRSDWGDGFSESRASLIVKGIGNSAPAWLAKRSPATALHPCISA
jgi:hypothetical protein